MTTLGGGLFAVDRSGVAQRRVALGQRSYATPAVSRDGTVYVGSDGGKIRAVAPDGRVQWAFDTDGDADTAPLLLEGGTVIAAAGAWVYGLTPAGTSVFRFAAKRKVFSAPALSRAGESQEPRVIIASQDGRVYALSTRGELVWSTDLGHDVDGGPVVGEDGSIFVGTDGDEVVCLRATGAVAWRASVGGFVRGPLSLARNGDVLAGVYGPLPRLVRVSPAGEVRGAIAVRGNGSREVGVQGGALEDDAGALAFGAQDGHVRAVERDGTERWSFDARAEIDAPLTLLADGTLLVATYAGDVLALRAGR